MWNCQLWSWEGFKCRYTGEVLFATQKTSLWLLSKICTLTLQCCIFFVVVEHGAIEQNLKGKIYSKAGRLPDLRQMFGDLCDAFPTHCWHKPRTLSHYFQCSYYSVESQATPPADLSQDSICCSDRWMQSFLPFVGLSKALRDMYSRKSRNAGVVDGSVRVWVHQKSWLQHISQRVDFFYFSGVQCISNCVCVKLTLHNTVWDLIQTMGLFLFCHTCNTHTSILSDCPRSVALSAETVWI